MRRIVAAFFVLWLGVLAGCQTAPERHYPIEADVISTDVEHKLITVKHGDIPGLMPAMTMTYQVAEPRQIKKLQPGDKITADLVGSENTGYLERIELVAKGGERTAPDVPKHAL